MENWRDVKAYTISDFLGWYDRGELNLSPKYQRNPVWEEKAKSYLIDTILRGLTVPPVFLRQQVNFSSQKIHREIIDGQQRLRAIIEFRQNEFRINKVHHKEYAEMYYDDMPDEAKEQFLNYILAVEIIRTTDESIIYDIFARLNANNYTLNHQEKRNAKFQGSFKVLAYQMAKMSKNFFIAINLFNEKKFARMEDVEWVSKFLIFLLEKQKTITNKKIDEIYKKYEDSFPTIYQIESEYSKLMNYFLYIFDGFDKPIFFNRPAVFFDLFIVLASFEELSQNQLFKINTLLKKIDKAHQEFFTDNNKRVEELKKLICQEI